MIGMMPTSIGKIIIEMSDRRVEDMKMTLEELIGNFTTTPFLFVGSGMSRRYLNLPDWKGLLKHFVDVIGKDEFAYNSFENKAKSSECKAGIMPKIAELIQHDYDEKWFADSNIRTVGEAGLKEIQNGVSPFKVEIAEFIRNNCLIQDTYADELDELRFLAEKSISGVITTNYDKLLENVFSGYSTYIGQSELIFSALQGVAEIYKIHGDIDKPESIVINEEDYLEFDSKSAYLAAKLLTIFMEYPIIFMGYSISDTNIINIIKSIVQCLNTDQLRILEDRFIFVEYRADFVGAEITPYVIMAGDKPLTMKRIILSDFMPLYKALENKRAKLPVRILRRFKQEIYDYTISSVPTGHLRVAALDDNRVGDEELVLSIGKMSDYGLKGLSGLKPNEWYRSIILDDLDFTADDLLEYAFPPLIKQNSGRLPINKYLSKATKEFEECKKIAVSLDFDHIISNTIKKNRKCLGDYTSVTQIWNQEKSSLEKATRLISHLPQDEMNVDELEKVLQEIFDKDVNVLETAQVGTRSHIRRLIMVYDYLKWGKEKELHD